MRPIQKSWKPAATSANGFLTGATGATWTLTATNSGDSLAHLVTITNNTANSHAAKTALLTGTDADGNVQTETMSLPAGSVATTSTKHFATLTSIVPSATIGADTIGIGWSAVAVSQTLVVDHHQVAPPFGNCVVTGTVNFSVQETGSDPFTSPDQSAMWAAPTAWSGKTASLASVFDFSITAVRLLVNSVTAGATVALSISQGGVLG